MGGVGAWEGGGEGGSMGGGSCVVLVNVLLPSNQKCNRM